MRLIATLAATALIVAGCGEDDGTPYGEAPATTASEPATEASPPPDPEAEPPAGGEAEKAGTEIVVGDSEFGEMLYDSKDQAIYIFENDGKDTSNCDGECAEAWPPVTTDGEPVAGGGVDESLLGTIERDDGTTQVTYDDQPLYFYAHEGRGEVRCHNVDLNGGFWWVVGPDGERLP